MDETDGNQGVGSDERIEQKRPETPVCLIEYQNDFTSEGATVSEEEQRAAVEKNYPMFSKPMTHDGFLSSFGGRNQVARLRGGVRRDRVGSW